MMEKTHRAVVRTLVTMAVYVTPLVWSCPARAAVFALTSFEDPGVFSGLYTDPGDKSTDHALTNNPNQPLVNWTQTGLELGFSSYYTNTRNEVGLTDGDYAGVRKTRSSEGVKSFQMSDTDGLMTTTLDGVSLIGYLDPTVSLDVFVADKGWEANDMLRIWATVDGPTEIDLFNTTGHDIDDLAVVGAWHSFSADLTGYGAATLAFALDSSAADESVYFDNVRFQGTVVPLPSSLVLGSLGIFFAACLRRS